MSKLAPKSPARKRRRTKIGATCVIAHSVAIEKGLVGCRHCGAVMGKLRQPLLIGLLRAGSLRAVCDRCAAEFAPVLHDLLVSWYGRDWNRADAEVVAPPDQTTYIIEEVIAEPTTFAAVEVVDGFQDVSVSNLIDPTTEMDELIGAAVADEPPENLEFDR